MQIAAAAVGLLAVTLLALVIILAAHVVRLRRRPSPREQLLMLSRMGACPDRPPDLHVVHDDERAVACRLPSPAPWVARRLRVSAVVLVIGAAATVSASSTFRDEMSGNPSLALPSNAFAEPQSVPSPGPDPSPSSIAQPPSSTTAPDVEPTVRSPASAGRPVVSVSTPRPSSQPVVTSQPPGRSPSSLRSGDPQPSPSDDEPLCVATVQVGVQVQVCPLD